MEEILSENEINKITMNEHTVNQIEDLYLQGRIVECVSILKLVEKN